MPDAQESQAHTISVRRRKISPYWLLETSGSQVGAYHGLILDSRDLEGRELRSGHCVVVAVVG